VIWSCSLLLLLAPFCSCKEKIKEKKESWAPVIDFFSPDTSFYPVVKQFPFPDSIEFAPLEILFTNQNKAPIIKDSMIIYFESYKVNGQKLCCKEDTLEVFTDTINGKKYLFAIGEYIAVFVSDTNSYIKLLPRKDPPVTLWGIQLNVSYPAEKFKEEYEKLGAKFVKIDPRIDEVYKRKWNDNDSILVESIQFRNSNDRVITQVYKDINKYEADSIVNYFKVNFPHVKYEEASKPGKNGIQLKMIKMNLNGKVILVTQTSADQYSFTITDYYETLRLIIRNAENGYQFRDDILIY
jgi:hypothetical protein